MTKAAIFDVDGTLVDSVDLHARAWQEALRDYGHDVDFAAVRGQIGKGGDQLMPEFLSAADVARDSEALEQHRGALFKQRYMDQVRPFPQVRALFERLLADGFRIALASSARQAELQVYRKLARIDDLVDGETTADDAERSKPHPDIFAAALKRLDGVAPGDVLVIGDTPYDAQAASKAGLRTIGMLCGGWPEADLRGAGCCAVYRDPAALLDGYAASPFAGVPA